jgi:hypothetical protein
MRAFSAAKLALGGGAAILLVAAGPAAQAFTPVTVPCQTAALIAAIKAANSVGGATINLAPGCTYALTTANNLDPMFGPNGLPVITSGITLNGFHTTIAGNHSNFRIFMVASSGNLTLQGLTVTGGSTQGPGGGIFNLAGRLTLNHSTVTGNAARGQFSDGGGIFTGTGGTGPAGTAVINDSKVNGNTSTGSAGGILNHGGTLILNFSQVNGNAAAKGGGGIASGPGGNGGVGTSRLVLNFSQVNGNTANGGPMTGAGGIANGGTAAINASVVAGNTTTGGAGGGILNHGVMTISLSRVNNNTASAGGVGGGIANINLGQVAPGAVNGGVLTITHSQLRGNTASGPGGGIFEATIDKGETLSPGNPLTLKFSLVTGNEAAQGGGIFAVSGSPVTLVLTLVIRNIPDNCFPPGSIPGCHG